MYVCMYACMFVYAIRWRLVAWMVFPAKWKPLRYQQTCFHCGNGIRFDPLVASIQKIWKVRASRWETSTEYRESRIECIRIVKPTFGFNLRSIPLPPTNYWTQTLHNARSTNRRICLAPSSHINIGFPQINRAVWSLLTPFHAYL